MGYDMTEEALVLLKPFELEAMLRRVVEAALKLHANPEPPELLSTEQLADLLGVSADLVRCWVRMHDCPHIRAGKKKLRFRLVDVLAWLEERQAA